MNDRPALRVAFITGQSDPRRWTLSPAQAGFLRRLRLAEGVGYPLNFPYLPGSPPHAPTPLWRASYANACIYWRSRTPAFRARYRPATIAMLEQAHHTVLLAGSCGIELLNNLQLPDDVLARVRVFAYGPVARCRPPCRSLLVQGRDDRLSRYYFPSVDRIVEARHLDYLDDPATLGLCAEFIACAST